MANKELAKQFAETQIGELKTKLEEAYLKGYEQATLDFNKSINIDGVEYVDMGLPSGTLWSKHPVDFTENNETHLRLFSYLDAKELPIPTLEQAEELINNSDREQQYIYGPSGGKIGYKIIDGNAIKDLGEGCRGETEDYFWVKGTIENNQAPVMQYGLTKDATFEYSTIFGKTTRHFIGFHLPVFLVKTKSEEL